MGKYVASADALTLVETLGRAFVVGGGGWGAEGRQVRVADVPRQPAPLGPAFYQRDASALEAGESRLGRAKVSLN